MLSPLGGVLEVLAVQKWAWPFIVLSDFLFFYTFLDSVLSCFLSKIFFAAEKGVISPCFCSLKILILTSI